MKICICMPSMLVFPHGIKKGIEYFSRYCFKVSNFSILTTLFLPISIVIRSIYPGVEILL